ncbi:hypothetical protein [Mycolicibacterium sp. 624]|uniref:hypothetical protein n=1 Tax=Mycolicibacterium sp. 624 TaxID=3156314 RepID=UPI003394E69B
MTQSVSDDLESATESAVRDGIDDIARFANSDVFRSALRELWQLAPEERPRFVIDVFMNRDALRTRGITVPAEMTIQRSTFRDNRPTLFCIVKHLPPGLLWEKVTITFDNPAGEPAIFYDEMVNGVQSVSEMI